MQPDRYRPRFLYYPIALVFELELVTHGRHSTCILPITRARRDQATKPLVLGSEQKIAEKSSVLIFFL